MEANMSFQDQLDSALSMVLGRERLPLQSSGKALPLGATGRILVGSVGLSWGWYHPSTPQWAGPWIVISLRRRQVMEFNVRSHRK